MTIKTYSAAGLLTGAILFACAAHATDAAPTPIDRPPTKVAEAAAASTATSAEDEDSATCNRSRKRLWVAGEGWIVRRVTICR